MEQPPPPHLQCCFEFWTSVQGAHTSTAIFISFNIVNGGKGGRKWYFMKIWVCSKYFVHDCLGKFFNRNCVYSENFRQKCVSMHSIMSTRPYLLLCLHGVKRGLGLCQWIISKILEFISICLHGQINLSLSWLFFITVLLCW